MHLCVKIHDDEFSIFKNNLRKRIIFTQTFQIVHVILRNEIFIVNCYLEYKHFFYQCGHLKFLKFILYGLNYYKLLHFIYGFLPEMDWKNIFIKPSETFLISEMLELLNIKVEGENAIEKNINFKVKNRKSYFRMQIIFFNVTLKIFTK